MGRLFWKFFFAIMLAQVGATVAIGGAFWLRDQAHRNTAPVLESGPPAMIALAAAESTLRHGGLEALRAMLPELRRPQLYVLDPQGHDLLGRAIPTELLHEAQQQRDDSEPRSTRRLRAADGSSYLAFASRSEFGPDSPRARRGGRGEPGPLPGLEPGAGRRLGHVVGIGAAVLASLLCAALLAWYFARPIRDLRSAFEAAAAGNLAPRFAGQRRGADELSDLGRDFDRMSERLRTVMDGQRRLLHDVSHELRSPLARLQAAVGLAQQQPDKIDSSLARITRESERIDRLVGELLTLSRLEATPEMLRRERLDLAELTDSVVADARFELDQRAPGQHTGTPPRITRTGSNDLQVQADPDLLASALDNLVRNALRYGAGGDIEVRLGLDGESARIDVLDHGPGVPEDHLGAIFQPFYRAGNASASVDGHGLGLAIAQRVIHAHGGAIHAANRAQGGLAVCITLPVAAPLAP